LLAVGATAWAEEAAAESGGLMGTLGISPKTVIGQLFAFVLLYLVFRKYLWGPILGLLASRQQEVQHIYGDAEAAQARAEAARLEYEAQLAKADEVSRERIAAALVQANAMKDEIIANAREQSDRIILSGRESVRMEMEKAQVQIRDSATRMAVDLAGRIIQKEIDPTAQRALVDQFIDGVGRPQ
jgi:F-type H+-transporting ATPase subunit b